MAEDTERHDDSAPGDTGQQPDSETARRAFIRKSAEVAAFSMFGVAGLDAVVEGVVREVGRLTGDRRMAGEAAEVLTEAGMTSRAEAQCIPPCGEPEWMYTCARVEEFPFDPSCFIPTPHECNEWQQWDPNCFVPNEHECSPWQPFYVPCGGEMPEYTCRPDKDKFSDCPEPSMQGTHTCITKFSCQEGKPTAVLFECGSVMGVHQFNCGLAGGGVFQCNGGDTLDFGCTEKFLCPNDHECAANHWFGCHALDAAPLFFCEAKFGCSAGGAACNVPGVGDYATPPYDSVPGDFTCGAPQTAPGPPESLGLFSCAGQFTCTGVTDDFICDQEATQGISFACNATDHFDPSTQCPSGEGHRFHCPTTDFHCASAETYVCAPPTYPFAE